jgi:hypothetical protein
VNQNCWQYKKCGRENQNELGICPAVTEEKAHKINGGKNGGRVCWAVAGTYCNGKVQGTYAEKVITCSECDFRMKVREEERLKFEPIFFKSQGTS